MDVDDMCLCALTAAALVVALVGFAVVGQEANTTDMARAGIRLKERLLLAVVLLAGLLFACWIACRMW